MRTRDPRAAGRESLPARGLDARRWRWLAAGAAVLVGLAAPPTRADGVAGSPAASSATSAAPAAPAASAASVTSARPDLTADLFRAIALDDDRTLARLLAQGADPNARESRGQVALYAALRDGSSRCAAVLAAAPGLDVDATNAHDETPLMMAAMRGDEAVARTLLSRGAAAHRAGWSPLHYAATGGNAALVRLFLDRGAPVDARAPDGNTPLMMAARYGSSEAAEVLLRAGADRTLVNAQGRDAAAEADAAERDGVARWLRAWVSR